MITVHIYIQLYIFCDDVPRRADHWNNFKMKQNKSNDSEVSDRPTEDIQVDELARDMYYIATVIRWMTLSEVKCQFHGPRLVALKMSNLWPYRICCITWIPGFWLRTNQIDPFQTYWLKFQRQPIGVWHHLHRTSYTMSLVVRWKPRNVYVRRYC